LLIAKVLVARYQKASRGVLTGLGIAIFAVAFTLVALNIANYALRLASAEAASAKVSAAVIATAICLSAAAFFRKGILRKPDSEKPAAFGRSADPQPSKASAPLTLTLAQIESQTHDAKTLRFILPQDRQVLARPGQFLTFEFVIDGKTVPRSYSICSSPVQKNYIEITPKRLESGHVSRFLNDRATTGLTVRARGPYGQFFFDEAKHPRIVLLAGGSGITPFRAMLRYIDDRNVPVHATLIYCVRAEHDLFFKDEFASLHNRLPRFRYAPVISNATTEWQGWRGHLRREILDREVEKLLDSTFFLCGPPAFMEHARALLQEMGVAPSQILQESFGSAIAGGKHSATSALYEVRFARTAATFKISPDDNLLECAEKNGVLVPSGCRQGVCGTCMTRLLQGNVDMETPEALDEERRSQGYILPCVSRATGDITLDA